MAVDLASGARETLKAFVPQIDKVLADIWDQEQAIDFGFNKFQKEFRQQMLDHARKHNLAPSKRIRSAFVYYGYKLASLPVSQGIWMAGAAIELVHTAILMQDDFMDEDVLRRGMETTNAFFAKQYGHHFGDVMAINTADVVLSMGYELLASCGLNPDRVLDAMKHLQRSINYTAVGQSHDVMMENVKTWDETDVLAVHSAKTGLYTYQNPLFVGAILAGLSEEVKEILKEYAQDGGVAFQIQDDILGVFGETADTGKSADSDLRQGKRTLLVLKTLEMGNTEQVDALKNVLGNKAATAEQVVMAKKAIEESGALKYNKDFAVNLAKKAVRTAEKLRKFDLNSEAIDFIQGVAEYMVVRKV